MQSPRSLLRSYLGLFMLLNIVVAITACGPAAEQPESEPAPTTEADVATNNGVLKIRRVVTGHSADGKAVVASDTEVEGIQVELFPGSELHQLWGGDAPPTYPDDGSPLDCPTWFPPVGGFRFIHFILPPDTDKPPEVEDEEAAVAEMEAKLPGLLGTMEPDNPGMHTSDTVDVLYVVSGRVILELDDGVEVELRAGDTAVQSGTRHRWHNRSSEPAHIIGALLGAHRGS